MAELSKLKGSQTESNLLKAFAGESQAKNRYEMYAIQARKDGYQQIAEIFELTSRQEESHAKTFFRFLEGGMLEFTATFPSGKIGTTEENLLAAVEGENEEWTTLYPEFAKIAEKEGYREVSTSFKLIAEIEAEHEARFLKLLDNIQNNKVFQRDTVQERECRKCGYVHKSKKALEKCPACKHPKSYFEIKPTNY
ncbi:MAG: rubrerythrin family protein [Marinilabiliales bacterium]|nr:MAG: rubrerythrin family protein [Marinilabiliales bacterium]